MLLVIRVGDILLSVNEESMVGVSVERAEGILKSLPRGLFRLTVMPPPKDVTRSSASPPDTSAVPPSPAPLPPHAVPPPPPHAVPPPQEPMSTTVRSDGGESIVSETLECLPGATLGFQIEGGSDTPLQYIYIKGLDKNSPACKCGQFNTGDQLVMIGDTCLIGVSLNEAQDILLSAPSPVQVVAQRKLHGESSTSHPENLSLDEIHVTAPPKYDKEDVYVPPECDKGDAHVPGPECDKGDIQVLSEYDKDLKETTATELVHVESENNDIATSADILITAASNEDLFDMSSIENLRRVRNTEPVRKPVLIPEDSITVELERAPGERLGIKIVGGRDNPNLPHIHVS